MDKEYFISRNNREVSKGELVGVHWNSHKNIYSVVKMNTRNSVGHVLGYTNNITLKNCTTKIDRSKQKGVRKNKVKDRHAFIVGEFKNFVPAYYEKEIYYNPYKLDDFVDRDDYESGSIEYLESMNAVSLVSMDGEETKYPKVFYS